ncbi:MAG: nitrogen fixation protein NifM [Candidatus Thiodiazotropha taylori]|nr:nitrogen fixation protein NifM [Candidatus Thiodiazotropha taylori]MCG7964778.1 nitrogen fixation protein NifM [Candidatus Thiodiazotropha endolucinida]MCG7910767.1 nitrogen fixation protein NifM [Candidatus Thiodiazotropha taylori]MCG7918568.1 nitrogen fixation protein NifM [Candidatus Thiodiazotropha taylori]MCG7925164.1 nitrogen fixation protein NifM [Candidatus Thiodiazotropha taylori]
MNLAEKKPEVSPVFSYHMLRNALSKYQKNLTQLNPVENEAVYKIAAKSFDLESLVIASKEAETVIVSEQQLDSAIQEVAERYQSNEEFTSDLQDNGLDVDGLRSALYRELLFDGVMQKVASRGADINDLDIQLFYEMHHDRFQTPETRIARHILITINPDFPENTRSAAYSRMENVIEKLAGRVNRFEQFAKRYSECPTAMEGGKLGEISRGQLYEALDAELFNMQLDEISPIVESDMGLHILYCEKIKPAKRVPLSKAAPRIREILTERQRRNCQKSWLNSLQAKLPA